MVHIALLMMLKNEEKRLHISLDSIIGVCDSMVIYDTGSTDRTIEILTDFSKKNKIPLHLKKGEFTDFASSRNVSLDFADTIPEIDFLLLLDCNDELRGGKKLRQFATKQLDSNPTQTAWCVCQEWYSGVYTKYYNIRFIRARESWRYNGVVHEWIEKKDATETYVREKTPPAIVIYQDRTQDDDKSGKRFHRDKVLLLEEYHKNPEDTRTVFYLAQTFSCLGEYANAYKYYQIRCKQVGFFEEVFNSYVRLGEIAKRFCLLNKLPQNAITEEDNEDTRFIKSLTWEDALGWFCKAYEHSERAEPLYEIADYYRSIQKFHCAYMYIKMACELDYPAYATLFVNNEVYEYKRFHLLGIVAFYCNHFEEGYHACLTAIKARSIDIDKKNLEHYEKVLFAPKNSHKSKKKHRR